MAAPIEEDNKGNEGEVEEGNNAAAKVEDDGEGIEKELTISEDSSSLSRLQAQRPVAPIHVVPPPSFDHPSQSQPPQVSSNYPAISSSNRAISPISLNSRRFTNKISLFIFLLHLLISAALVCYMSYRSIEGAVEHGRGTTLAARRERRTFRYWLAPIEGAAVVAVVLAFLWQKCVRIWPSFMVAFIPWAAFSSTMAAGILLLCFSLPSTDGEGVALIIFSIGTGLYACWSSRRVPFAATVFRLALLPVSKFPGLNRPAYLMLAVGFLWTSLWCFAMIGAALNFHYAPSPLVVVYLVLSLAWTAEVMRNVTNLTVSRVVALYYLRGMQCSSDFSFQRAITFNLGGACFGSLLVPAIKALRIIARGLNLLEGEDEFMFFCAHCCLRVMEWVFHYGNSWAFVHIAAYGSGFVEASQSTWAMFEREGMEELVDSDISSSVCFLTGVASGALCLIFAASWTFAGRRHYTPTVSLLSFWVGYLMTRIGMALPQACVGCYYVCFAENPAGRLFDSTIPDRLAQLRSGRDPYMMTTPRFPRRFPTSAAA